MTELITQTELTRPQADEKIALWHATGKSLRTLLLEMFEGNAHTAVGYKRWDDFCSERLEMSDSKYAYVLLDWARVERSIPGIPGMEPKKLTYTVAKELAKLPDSETQAKVYSEVDDLKMEGLRTPKEYVQEIKKRVGFLLKQAKPEPTTAPPADNFTKQEYPVKPPVSSYSEKFHDGGFSDEPQPPAPPVLQVQPAPKQDATPDWELWELELQIALSAVKFHSGAQILDPIGTMAILNEIVAWIEECR